MLIITSTKKQYQAPAINFNSIEDLRNKLNDFGFYLECYQKDLIKFEGDMWQDLNPIVVLLEDIEQYKKDGFDTSHEIQTSKKMIHDFMIKYS
ncbi:MAG: hypothetical protein AAF403_00120 [Pseudomonadota bacterium]